MIPRSRHSPSLGFSIPVNILVMLLAFSLIPARAADYKIFLGLRGFVVGESADPYHKEYIDIIAFQHGLSRIDAVTQFQDFVVYKLVDSASASLHMACAEGVHLSDLSLEITPAVNTQTAFFKIWASGFQVISISMIGDTVNGGSRPIEVVKFKFEHRIEWTYTPIGPDGAPGAPVKKCWDINANLCCGCMPL